MTAKASEAADLDSKSLLMAVRPSGGPRALSRHLWFSDFISGALKVDRASPLPHSKREFRPITRYHDNLIAIEAFKRPYAPAQCGRIDPDKHWGTAIWARMNVNFVGREAKERVRHGHIALLRSI